MKWWTIAILAAWAAGVGQAAVTEKIPLPAQPFALQQVRLLGGPFKDAMERDHKYLLELDADRLLALFRTTAGLPSSAEPYGGWEAPGRELHGHTLGHYLSACALMYASTGDQRLKDRVAYLVGELAKCQAAMPTQGFHTNYLSAYSESFFDRVDAGQPVWAPYYTLHKILAGLFEVHQQCGNPQALDVLVKMADWLQFRVGRLSPEQQQKVLNCEHGGMNEVLANLAAVTGDPAHLALARAFNHEIVFAPLARGEDALDGKHANTQIPKIIGAAREFELTGEPAFGAVASNFWKYVALDRAYCIGGHSDREHFFPVAEFAKHLAPDTAETCNTYNMLKLTRHLFAWGPSARTMDFYERALYNQILASQDPDTGMMYYFASLKPGHFKSYNTPHDSFWCCTGTGMENHAKYGDTIFHRGDGALYVNLFIPAELTWQEQGLVVRQETKFPESDTTRLSFQCAKPVRLALKIRQPYWAGAPAAAVNGNAAAWQAGPDGYATIEREWKSGDRVEARFPMTLRTEALPGEPRTVALLYGPIVLAGELGRAGMEKLDLYVKGQSDFSRAPTPDVPVLVCEPADLLAHVAPVAGRPLTFRTQGIGRPADVTLSPYYALHHQRFTVYWPLCSEAEWKAHEAGHARAEAARKAMEARVVDALQPGEQQPETDHNLKQSNSNSGEHAGRKWRDAHGWFSYELKVAGDRPMTLRCTYWGSDVKRSFDILVDGAKLATETLVKKQPGEFFEADYPIPGKLTQGKDRVTVRFEAHKGSVAGGLFGVVTLKP